VKKIRRNLDGKVYAVHGEDEVHVVIHDPLDRGQMLILKQWVTEVDDDTPVDVP
jgi:hypothetical protein